MENKHYIEKEIKFKIEDINGLMNKLKNKNAKFISSSFQRTVRFDTSSKDLEKQGKFLRTRTGHKNVVTLKINNKSQNIFESQEIEFETDHTEKIRTIFNELGFGKELVMEKYRVNLELDGVDISLDELPFGFFIELEGEEDKIFEMANKLGFDLNKKIVVTYWDLFEIYKKENKREDLGESIVFEKNHTPKIEIET